MRKKKNVVRVLLKVTTTHKLQKKERIKAVRGYKLWGGGERGREGIVRDIIIRNEVDESSKRLAGRRKASQLLWP